MRTLVLLRRALLVIIEEGYPNRVRDFAQKLNCNGQTIVQITDMLRKQGFLLATPGSKSKGFLEKGLPKFTLSTEPAIKERLRNEIFNPLAKISHHYNLSDNNAVQRYGSVEHSSSDVSTDVLSVEEVPRDSPGYEQRCRERRNGGIAGAVGAMPTPEVNEIRSAWKTLGSSLDFANPVQPKGNSQSPTQAQMQAQMQAQKQKQKRSIMGTELGSGIACGADGEDQARQGFNGIQTQTRPAEWVRDGNDFGSDYGNGEGMVVSGSEEENGNNRRKRVRLSKLGSPISIFEPSSESGVGSGSEGEDGSMCESASV
ncbi:meiosis specific protein Hop1 [Histoplasma capsulatum G186AR]|nr:meiosis specific protein Hop1 [Histoplasma capsulatum]QSS69069.1 meiosis specific protein Hop1 [Histoplasma capsulatum G186AR]